VAITSFRAANVGTSQYLVKQEDWL
jgi:hypothetical protein